ncbi:hypothetical protein QTN25_001281 [Entamoeba marina]
MFFDHSDDENDKENSDSSDNNPIDSELDGDSNQSSDDEKEKKCDEYTNCEVTTDKKYDFGNFGFVEDGIECLCKKKSLNQKQWKFSEGALSDCDARNYVNNCEKTEFVNLEDKSEALIFK